MVVFTAPRVVSRPQTGDLAQAVACAANGTGRTLNCPVTVESAATVGRSTGLALKVNSASGSQATMDIKLWGLLCLQVLFDKSDLTEAQFLAALDTDELGEMVGSIADDQVFVMQIRISRSSFNGNWEGHVNHVTRAP